MSYRPNRLVLPASLTCTFPPRLRLSTSDMGDWAQLEVLSLTPEALVQAGLQGLRGSQHEFSNAFEALKSGQVPAAEVLRVTGTEQQALFESTSSLLQALARLGYQQLPVVATRPAAKWLRASLGAQPAPDSWRLEAE